MDANEYEQKINKLSLDNMALRVQNGKLQRQIDLLRRRIKMDANEYEKKINDLSLDNRALRFQNGKLQIEHYAFRTKNYRTK